MIRRVQLLLSTVDNSQVTLHESNTLTDIMHSNHKDLLTVKLLSTIRHYVPNLESHQFIVDL